MEKPVSDDVVYHQAAADAISELEKAYWTASRAADRFRTALVAALGLPENPGDDMLIGLLHRRMR